MQLWIVDLRVHAVVLLRFRLIALFNFFAQRGLPFRTATVVVVRFVFVYSVVPYPCSSHGFLCWPRCCFQQEALVSNIDFGCPPCSRVRVVCELMVVRQNF